DQRKNDLRAQMFATPGLLIALLAILGYLFGVKGMYSLSQSSGMALPTAIGELLLGIGILLTVRDRGVGVLLLDEGAAGVLTPRRGAQKPKLHGQKPNARTTARRIFSP